MAEIKVQCFSCQTELTFQDMISRRDECTKCRADVRCCKNCRFYDPKVYNECKEPQADPIRDRDRSNLCDFFQAAGAGNKDKTKEDLLKAAEALFKNSK